MDTVIGQGLQAHRPFDVEREDSIADPSLLSRCGAGLLRLQETALAVWTAGRVALDGMARRWMPGLMAESALLAGVHLLGEVGGCSGQRPGCQDVGHQIEGSEVICSRFSAAEGLRAHFFIANRKIAHDVFTAWRHPKTASEGAIE